MKSLSVVLALAVLAACGGDSDDDDDNGADAGPRADAADRPDAGADPVFDRVAGTIRLVEGAARDFEGNPLAYTRAEAQLSDAVTPLFQTETMRSGSCRLLEFESAFCDPFCNGVCLPGNQCVEFPTYMNAGSIALTGLTEAMTLVADPPLNWYSPSQWPIPEDLFAPGSEITASAPGNALPAFSVTAYGVTTLETSIDQSITIVDDQDFTVTWTPASDGARVRLTLNSPNQAHGQPLLGIIECDAPDTGSLTIPGELIGEFPTSAGAQICVGHDCPPSYLVRYTRGTAALGGEQVELVIGAEVQFGVVHE